MISIERVWEGIREEGLNFGLPTLYLELGEGREYASAEELIRETLTLTRCRWVCILGEKTTQVGMGTLVKGLSAVGLNVELECPGSVRDPGWLHTADRWVVDYVKDGAFNYTALRSQDMVRFLVKNEGDLAYAREGFEALRLFSGTKCVKVLEEIHGVFDLVKRYDRSRVYRC